MWHTTLSRIETGHDYDHIRLIKMVIINARERLAAGVNYAQFLNA